MLAFMFVTFMFFMIQGSGTNLPFLGYVQLIGYALLMIVVLTALACIPVLIVCYFIKKIPDIDYSILVATGVTIIGIISELF